MQRIFFGKSNVVFYEKELYFSPFLVTDLHLFLKYTKQREYSIHFWKYFWKILRYGIKHVFGTLPWQ